MLTAGVGDDQVFGQAGNDRMIWNPGDGSALNEGGAGSDTVEVIGGNVAEVYSITANGSRVRLDRVNPAPFFLDIGTSENLVLNARGGEDVISAGNGLAGLIQLTLDGGAGNDTITGGDGDDVLLGGVGVGELDQNDLIIGGRGNDTLFGEDGHNSGFGGNDVFVWNPGDGSDTVEGEGGMNFLQFNGSNASEHIDISANGERVRFSRDIDNVTMDLNDIVQLNFTALGGADVITVNDLSGTDLRIVPLDLAAAPGGTASDGVADTVVVNGTNGDDVVDVPAVGNALAVLTSAGRFVFVRITDPTDRLVINGLGGDDQISAPTLPAATAALTIDGGAGNDVILGGAGNDTLTGGSGNDFIVGGAGNDIVFLGAGDDDFQWNPGDGSDIVEGQAGFDTMLFIGSDAGEKFDLSANGGRLRFTRDVDNVALDVDDTERVDVAARGGADTVTVNDLSGTNVTEVNINLAVVQSGGDGDADTVIINGTKRDDTIRVAGGAGRCHGARAGRPGEHHRRRGGERPAHGRRAGRRRHGARLGPLGRRDPPHGGRRGRRRRPDRQRGRRHAPRWRRRRRADRRRGQRLARRRRRRRRADRRAGAGRPRRRARRQHPDPGLTREAWRAEWRATDDRRAVAGSSRPVDRVGTPAASVARGPDSPPTRLLGSDVSRVAVSYGGAAGTVDRRRGGGERP